MKFVPSLRIFNLKVTDLCISKAQFLPQSESQFRSTNNFFTVPWFISHRIASVHQIIWSKQHNCPTAESSSQKIEDWNLWRLWGGILAIWAVYCFKTFCEGGKWDRLQPAGSKSISLNAPITDNCASELCSKPRPSSTARQRSSGRPSLLAEKLQRSFVLTLDAFSVLCSFFAMGT